MVTAIAITWPSSRSENTSGLPVITASGGQQFYVNAITQLTMADFISSGHYDRHIRRMRTRYRQRRDTLVDALAGFDVGISGLSAGLHLMLTVAVECVLVTRSCGVPLRGLGFGLSASGPAGAGSYRSSVGAG